MPRNRESLTIQGNQIQEPEAIDLPPALLIYISLYLNKLISDCLRILEFLFVREVHHW